MAKGPGFAPVAGITPRRPLPSILTSARDRTGDGFGLSARPNPLDPAMPPSPGWGGGISWRSAACAAGFRWEYCASGEKEDPPAIVAPTAYPYAIYVPYACDWVLPSEEDGYSADALAQLDAVTAWHMSREIMVGGTEDENDNLSSVAVDVSAAEAVHPVTALGTLLEAYFDCPAAGALSVARGSGTGAPVVHAPLSIVTSLIANNVVKQNGDVYLGPGGSIVSPGPGYPTGTTAEPLVETPPITADAWMYISGPVEYALGTPVALDDMFDRRMNRYEVLAERLVIHRFDPCCVFAIGVYQPSPTDSENV